MKKYNKIFSLLLAFSLIFIFPVCRDKLRIEIEKVKDIALNNANVKKMQFSKICK